jgi:ATP-binding cassette, subfamily C, bacterial
VQIKGAFSRPIVSPKYFIPTEFLFETADQHSNLFNMKYSHVLQHSEEDCGAACLATVARHYGRRFSLNYTREAVGTGQLGTTLLGLQRGATEIGFNATPVRTSVDVLDRMPELPLPAIIHWQGKHWVVLYGTKGKKMVIADPAIGIRYLSRRDLAVGWSDWLMLLLQPDADRLATQRQDTTPTTQSFWQFGQRIWSHHRVLLPAIPLNLMLGLLSLASPFLLQILTDDVLIRGDLKLLTTVVIGVVALQFVSTGLELIQSNLIANFAQRLELSLVLDFGRQVLRLPLSYYESRRSGEIVSRLRDIQSINQLVSQAIVILPSQFVVAIVSLTLMLIYSWKLTMVALGFAILMTVSSILFLPMLQNKTRELLVSEAENQGILVETFKGALTVKTTAAAPQLWAEYQRRFGRLANLTLSTMQIGIVNHAFSSLVAGISGVSLLWFGGSLVINPVENLSIGQLLAFTSMNGNVLALIGTVIRFLDEFAIVKTATQRLNEVIDSTPEDRHDASKPIANLPAHADISCHHLRYHYPGRVELLEDFSLTIPGGKTVALIGKSGCGKSTLVKIIAGLYPVQSGNLRIGSYNLQDLPLACLRQQVILVPQEAHFWSRSILENLQLGDPNLSFEAIVTACKIADADSFISRLPDKYQTVLGEFGATISGGQRQRLAIARAIASDPPILILDESTAGLDPASEAAVLNRLLAHRQGKTTLLISHRPRVIRRADWIIFFDQGQVVRSGTLADLQAEVGEHLDFLTP